MLKSYRQTAVLWLSPLFFITAVQAEVKVFEPSFPAFNAQNYQQRSFKTERIGTAHFKNNVRIPVEGIAILNPLNDIPKYYRTYKPCTDQQPCRYDFTLPAQSVGYFKIVIFPNIGAILAPVSWQVIEADMGPSGVASALLMSPDRKEAIEIYNSSACVGCGMPYASLYFPEILKKSVENEFGGYVDQHKYLNIVRANPHKVLFSFKNPAYPAKSHGIALYSDNEITNYQNITVHLLPEHQAQARTVLNFFPFKNQFNFLE